MTVPEERGHTHERVAQCWFCVFPRHHPWSPFNHGAAEGAPAPPCSQKHSRQGRARCLSVAGQLVPSAEPGWSPGHFLCIGASLVTQQWRICLQCRRPGFDPWARKIPWRREWLPTPVFLPEKFHDRGDWWAIAHGVAKSQTQLSN